MPERRKRSVLMIAAALLLVVSAALLYSRLRDKLETQPVPPVATDIAPDLSAAPPPAPRPNTTPGAAHTPDTGPHATSPSSLPAPVETAPVVRVTEADQSSGWDTWITDQTGATRERISGIRPQHRD
jgi:hypothetical protein